MKNNLQEILKSKGIAKADFSRAMDVKWATVQNWCKAKSMNSETMYNIAKELDVNVHDVFQI